MAHQLQRLLLLMSTHSPHDENYGSSLHAATQNVASRKRARLRELFHRFAHRIATATGSPYAFLLAVLIILIWGLSGRLFKYSDTWQLWINTGTTIVTFLMVFLIQNTQNRDAKAIHLKLDELIRAKKGARNTLVDLESCTDEELDEIEREFKRLRERAGHRKEHAPHEHAPHEHAPHEHAPHEHAPHEHAPHKAPAAAR
jgi:low affinity Fe/Cu permease